MKKKIDLVIHIIYVNFKIHSYVDMLLNLLLILGTLFYKSFNKISQYIENIYMIVTLSFVKLYKKNKTHTNLEDKKQYILLSYNHKILEC